jgi:hypothetical protein
MCITGIKNGKVCFGDHLSRLADLEIMAISKVKRRDTKNIKTLIEAQTYLYQNKFLKNTFLIPKG